MTTETHITAGELTARHIGKRVRVESDDSIEGQVTSVEHQIDATCVVVRQLRWRDFTVVPHDTPVSLLDADDRSPLDGQEALL